MKIEKIGEKLKAIAKKVTKTKEGVVQNVANVQKMNNFSQNEFKNGKALSNNKANNLRENNFKSMRKKENQNGKIKEKEPVIIRREVIIDDEKNHEENQVKKKEKSNIGFVERQKSQLNIVYRQKRQKPKNISDFFGLNKNKKKQEQTQQTDKTEQIEQTQKTNKEKQTSQNNQINKEIEKQEQTKKVEDVQNKKVPNKQEQNKVEQLNYPIQKNDKKKSSPIKDTTKSFNSKTIDKSTKKNQVNKNQNQNQNNKFKKNNNNNNNNNNKNFNNNNNFNNNSQNKNNKKDQNKQKFDNKQKPFVKQNQKDNEISDFVAKDTSKEIARQNENKFKNQKQNRFDDSKKKKSKKGNSNQTFDDRKIKDLKMQTNLTNMFNDTDGGMLDYYDLTTTRGKKNKKAKNKENESNETKQKIFKLTNISIPETISVKNLATELKKTSSEIIKKLFDFGIMATINQDIDFDTAYLIAEEFGVTATKIETKTEEDILFDESEDKEDELAPRPPVVVVMGHVDHGKTSLLDVIKKTNVISGEAGGITQHIGAYKVKIGDKEITFLDTPGHEAFTAMRARGAQITDIAILIVAANDGVMPQTIEAINHAKAAGIPIIVAINKIDLPDANIERVKEELMRYELVPEEWGGDTIFVPISAKNNQNIDTLLEMVLLQAEMLELKANPTKQAKGVVIESRLDKSKGPIATLLVQRGKLDIGDTIVVGTSIGHIRTMVNDKGKKIKSAGPSTPVSISGLSTVPEGGEVFYEVDNEKMAKHLIEKRIRQARDKKISEQNVVTIENFYEKMKEEKFKILNLIVKADVQGSVEALKQSLEKIANEEVKVKVIHAAPGGVNQSDVTLAKVSNAIIIAFNVRPDSVAQDIAKKDNVEIKQYSVIYQAIDDIENAIKGMLSPKFQERVIGNLEVRDIFKMSTIGTIGGCFVLNGKVEKNAGVRVIRDNIVIHDGKLSTLKRFKDDVKEVTKGFECGITIENYNDIKIGDNIEVYIMEEIKR